MIKLNVEVLSFASSLHTSRQLLNLELLLENTISRTTCQTEASKSLIAVNVPVTFYIHFIVCIITTIKGHGRLLLIICSKIFPLKEDFKLGG